MKPAKHLVCGGVFILDPELPPRYDAAGRLISPGTCCCGLPGEPGDAHHTVPPPTEDGQMRAAGERSEG